MDVKALLESSFMLTRLTRLTRYTCSPRCDSSTFNCVGDMSGT